MGRDAPDTVAVASCKLRRALRSRKRMYYLCNPAYPGVNIALNVTM